MPEDSSMEALNTALTEAKQRLRERQKWESKLTSCQSALEGYRKQVSDLKAVLDEEQHHLDSLQGVSIRHLFHALLGNTEEEAAETKKEVLAAKLKYDTALASMQRLETETERLQNLIHQASDVEQRYNLVLQEKERRLVQENSPMAEVLVDLAEAEGDIKANLKELREAIEAATRVQGSLGECLKALDSARSWGAWDMMGGGMITTAIKRDHMDDAQMRAREAQADLENLKAELEDVDRTISLTIDTEGFLGFADYFFDGLIVDWMVQDHIVESIGQVESWTRRIRQLYSDLQEQLDTEQQNLEDLRQRRYEVIEDTDS